jgi:hypothetical protein
MLTMCARYSSSSRRSQITPEHIIGNVRVWADLMAERPIQPAADEALTTADLLLAAWQGVYTDLSRQHYQADRPEI